MKSWRVTFFLSTVGLATAIIIAFLFYMQVVNHKFYQAQALGQQAGFSEIVGDRGKVFFQNSKDNRGNMGDGDLKSLAINKDKWLVSAVPSKVEDKDAFATALSPLVSMSKEAVLAKLDQADSYAIIKKDLTEQEIGDILKLTLPGLNLENTPARYYPQEVMLAQVIGFVGGESGIGQYGLEGYYDDLLKGKEGIMQQKKGLDIINSKAPENMDGSDLYLTIDYNIQFEAEALLKEVYRDIDIDSGQIIVLKPDTGRVLALANFPSYNANLYSKQKDLGIFQNSAVQKLFEPGSIFKPFTMAMALQEGRVTPSTTFTDTGSVVMGPDTIRNFDQKKYGLQDMSGILEKSINTGAVFLSQQISHQTFLDYLDKLGFNDKTGIDLQGEVASQNSLLKNGSPFGFATASFGQGIEMTPIQLASAFCVFANHGKMVKPYVVEKIAHGGEQENTRPVISEQIISPTTASQVTTMLTNVVDRGFGSNAKIPGYYLAGKTGTAQVPYENKKGYYADKTIQSFVGFGPALKPQFLILVKLDNPKVPKSSLSAAPVFKKLSQYIIDYWQLPPDY